MPDFWISSSKTCGSARVRAFNQYVAVQTFCGRPYVPMIVTADDGILWAEGDFWSDNQFNMRTNTFITR